MKLHRFRWTTTTHTYIFFYVLTSWPTGFWDWETVQEDCLACYFKCYSNVIKHIIIIAIINNNKINCCCCYKLIIHHNVLQLQTFSSHNPILLSWDGNNCIIVILSSSANLIKNTMKVMFFERALCYVLARHPPPPSSGDHVTHRCRWKLGERSRDCVDVTRWSTPLWLNMF